MRLGFSPEPSATGSDVLKIEIPEIQKVYMKMDMQQYELEAAEVAFIADIMGKMSLMFLDSFSLFL